MLKLSSDLKRRWKHPLPPGERAALKAEIEDVSREGKAAIARVKSSLAGLTPLPDAASVVVENIPQEHPCVVANGPGAAPR